MNASNPCLETHPAGSPQERLLLRGIFQRDPAFAFLLIFAFCAGFSLPLARTALVAATAFTVRDVRRRREAWGPPVTAKAWMAYLVLATVTTALVAAFNTDELITPLRGLGKISKLIWFVAIPIVPKIVTSRERFLQVVTALALGTGIEASRVLFLHTSGAWIQVTLPLPGDPPADSGTGERILAITNFLGITERLQAWIADPWRARTYNDALAKLSGMGTAQRLMAGTLVSLALSLHAMKSAATRSIRPLLGLTLLVLAGLVLALKRGPWISALLVAVPMLMAGTGIRRTLPALLLTLAVAASLPAVRGRIAQLPSEFEPERGGRALMWTKVVAGCRRDHPWGVGFRGLTNETMRRYARRVEQRQNHVHSNPLQVLVELGWQGLLAYLLWMGLAVRESFRFWKGTGQNDRADRADASEWNGAEGFLRAIPLVVLASLLLNGLVEYNLASGDLVLIYGLAMGLAAVRWGSPSSSRS